MICKSFFRSNLRAHLIGALLLQALGLGALFAEAEILVPFTPANLLEPSVEVTVTNADGLYTYSYEISLDGSHPEKQQKARKFVLELHGDVSDIRTPRGWMFGQYRVEPKYSWSCIEAEPLKPGEVDDGNLPPCRYSIAPGAKLGGFSFRSVHPPGNVTFKIQGETKWPVATSEDDDLGPGADPDLGATGVTTGPVPLQDCAGAADGADCDDGRFCNGLDACMDGKCLPRAANPCTGPMYCKGAPTCPNGTCEPHAGNPCRGEADGDDDCKEACDEDNNGCGRYDRSGSSCADDGNPCTQDECVLGECTHTPGNAGAICGPPPAEGYSERTCTGASIVCPSTSISLDEINKARLASEEKRNAAIAHMLKNEREALDRIRLATFQNTNDDNQIVAEMAKGLRAAGDPRGAGLVNEYFAAVDGDRNPGASNEIAAQIFRDIKLYDRVGIGASPEMAPAMLEGLRKFRHSSALRTGCGFFDMRWPGKVRMFDVRYAQATLVAIDRAYAPPPPGADDFCAEAFKSQLSDPDVHRAFFRDVYPQLTPAQKKLADRLSREPPAPLQ